MTNTLKSRLESNAFLTSSKLCFSAQYTKNKNTVILATSIIDYIYMDKPSIVAPSKSLAEKKTKIRSVNKSITTKRNYTISIVHHSR